MAYDNQGKIPAARQIARQYAMQRRLNKNETYRAKPTKPAKYAKPPKTPKG